jgi:hypothetical protein
MAVAMTRGTNRALRFAVRNRDYAAGLAVAQLESPSAL